MTPTLGYLIPVSALQFSFQHLLARYLSSRLIAPYFSWLSLFLVPNILTRLLFSAYGRLTVEKRCGFSGVCPSDSVSWWSDECDRKSDEDSYTCTTCCTQTMCNQATCHVPYTCLLSLALIYHLSKLLNKSFTSWKYRKFYSSVTSDPQSVSFFVWNKKVWWRKLNLYLSVLCISHWTGQAINPENVSSEEFCGKVL